MMLIVVGAARVDFSWVLEDVSEERCDYQDKASQMNDNEDERGRVLNDRIELRRESCLPILVESKGKNDGQKSRSQKVTLTPGAQAPNLQLSTNSDAALSVANTPHPPWINN